MITTKEVVRILKEHKLADSFIVDRINNVYKITGLINIDKRLWEQNGFTLLSISNSEVLCILDLKEVNNK